MFLLGMIAAATPIEAKPEVLSWLAGYWLQCTADGEASEVWSDARGDVLLGVNRVLGAKLHWEYARIEPAGDGLAFHAQPLGRPAAAFPAVEVGPTRVVFENAAHGFPQRILYSRDGDRLDARIEGTIEGKFQSAEWHYVRADLNSHCPETAG